MGVLVRVTALAALGIPGIILQAADPQLLLATSLSPIIQNEQADAEGLGRIANDKALSRYVKSQLLVRVPAETKTYYLKGIPTRYRYLRPQSKRFLDTVGSQYFREFGKRLRVTSMVRTGQLQLQLARYNGNAAPASGPTQSSHLTGATLDISKTPMGPDERDWMREKIGSWSEAGYLYGIEERVQPTFHIMVYGSFPGTTIRPPAQPVKLLAAKSVKHHKAKAKRPAAKRAKAHVRLAKHAKKVAKRPARRRA